MAHIIEWETRGIFRKFTGKISGREILESNIKLQQDPRFRQMNYVINDFCEVTEHYVEPCYTGVYAASDELKCNELPQFRIALVANQPDIRKIAKAYQQQVQDQKFDCELFTLLEGARNWVASS